MRLTRNSRWSLAFADLSLLMLGFMALHNVREEDLMAVVEEVSGGSEKDRQIEFAATELFEPEEAMISIGGRERLGQFANRFKNDRRIGISIKGGQVGSKRLDGWELSAARLASVGRTLQNSGVNSDLIDFESPQLLKNRAPQKIIITLGSMQQKAD